MTPVTMVINFFKILFAVSPLLALAYVLMTGFEDKDGEDAKRNKKADFQMEGHAE
eukprot:CAMPEP_0203641160 /NCGR_PEP_ID=MMETSP0088-20131115/6479_1 /ASSEMBLY_ACC=CAM_ASM_001087 /TAXON_ID=426623 /ORGANISM="Chaetoceros affinis, Strain CCMP159" /LENGTH=54 /DNA_ID=CAMNT_0050496523 /DNA_START=131 /DNA_END=295 /DNA_ORIENTATION=+